MKKNIYSIGFTLLALLSTVFSWARAQDSVILPQENTFAMYGLSASLVRIHLDIWFWFVAPALTDESQVLATLEQVKQDLRMDIVPVMEFSFDRQKTLDIYLNHMDQTLNTADILLTNLKNQLSEYEQNIATCTEDKRRADIDYFTYFQDYDYKFMQEALQASLDAQRCMGDNRIKFNAMTTLYLSLQFNTNLLKKKSAYLSSKTDVIIYNFALLKPELLQELGTIAEASRDFSEYAQ